MMTSSMCPPEAMLRNAIRGQSNAGPSREGARGVCLGEIRGMTGGVTRWYLAARCTELGKPLTVVSLPSAEELGPGEVKVAVHSTGINYADILKVAGQYQEKPSLPFSPGVDFAGVVLEVEAGVKIFKKGDRVAGVMAGSMAEEIVVNAGRLWQIPDSISFNEAAAIPCNYGTALLALTRKAQIKQGETLVVTAAAGGTGLAAVDIAANALGAKVIGAAGGPEKCQLVRSRGAMECIDYKTESIRERTMELTNGEGANVILDVVGGNVWKECLRSIAWEGRAIVIGFASGEIPRIPANILLLKSISAIGMYWGRYSTMDNPTFKKSVSNCFDLYIQGKINPHVCKTFPLDQVNEAFEYMKNRQSTGKAIIAIR